MPTYTYTCTACNDVVEKRQRFSDPPLTTCEQCGGTLRKIIHPVGIVFKGSGWYITDSRSSTSAANGGTSTSTSSESSATKSETSKADTSKADTSKADTPKSAPSKSTSTSTSDTKPS